MSLTLQRAIPRVAARRPANSRGSVLLWILGIFGVGAGLLAIVVLDTITLNREARTLRAAMFRELGSRPSTRIELSAGPLLLGGARAIVGVIDRVPPEAQLALRSVRDASVGVYTLTNSERGSSFGRLLASADDAMTRSGWNRVVGVVQPRECVLVYSPANASGDGPARFCVGVCSGRDLVIVSATARPEELAELVAQQRGRGHF